MKAVRDDRNRVARRSSDADAAGHCFVAVARAAASPIVGVVHADEILTSQDGTLELRRNRSGTDFSDLSAVPSGGSCAITASTGVYAGLHGDGTIHSLANVIARTETDTIVLNVA